MTDDNDDVIGLPRPTVDAIFRSYSEGQDPGYRDHLGASLIGNDCRRAIWYSWRWATRANFEGRMLRLFQTGHLAEERFIAELRKIGVTVWEVDPETGRQWAVRDSETGHFGGSLDGKAIGLLEAPRSIHVLEFKTHSAKSFKGLVTNGVQKSKPQHWAQMQVYMHFSKVDRAFYLATCKDNDELYQERVPLDRDAAQALVNKAHSIIRSAEPPERISTDPSWFQCRLCDHAPACHGTALPERHCRSCLHSTPVEGGQWHCASHDTMLRLHDQRAGCARHLYIPALVPGEQIDAGETWVEYRLRDGSTWKDQP